jgi:hypothetical protein
MPDPFLSHDSGLLASTMAALAKVLSLAFGAVVKLMPAALGALLMILVDMPKTKREYFIRFAAAFIVSIMFGRVLFDFLDSFAWLSFLDRSVDEHRDAVSGLAGALGYFFLGGLVQLANRFRIDPLKTISEVKEAAK